MSSGFGGGFGGDFDDLLPTRSPAPPNLNNPFEDPFADIGRAQDNDPWATYTEQKPQSPVIPAQTNPYEPSIESHVEPTREPVPVQSPPSPVYEQTASTYSIPEPEPTPVEYSVPEYRAPTPTLPGPQSAPPEVSPPTPPPAPVARPTVTPISPSKAGLFDEPSASTFGSGFIRRHKTQRSSGSSAPGMPNTEGRSGSLFASAKADPLEALVSKARSVSTARTPPITPKPEPAPVIKTQPEETPTDPLAPAPSSKEEAPITAQPPATDLAPSSPKVESTPTPSSAPEPEPVSETKEDDASTPKDATVPLESLATPLAAPATPVADPPTPEPLALPVVSQPEEKSSTPTPPSRAASETLGASQYPEGSSTNSSAFLNPHAQNSPGPGAYARVVSPLDTPTGSTRTLSQSFSGLALGGEAPNLGWGGHAHPAELPAAPVTPATRSAGWGAVDEAWGGGAPQSGWGGENEASFVGQGTHPEQYEGGLKDGESVAASGHSRKMSESNESEDSAREQDIDTGMGPRSGTPQVCARTPGSIS